MIEVNLLPGTKRDSKRTAFSLALPTVSGFTGKMDRWVASGWVAGAAGVAAVAFFWFSAETAREEIDIALEEAVRDSTRFADIIERSDLLQARSDSVIRRVSVIQEIDEGRYVWPHVFDEVARALPDYTWIEAVLQVTRQPAQIDVVQTVAAIALIGSRNPVVEKWSLLPRTNRLKPLRPAVIGVGQPLRDFPRSRVGDFDRRARNTHARTCVSITRSAPES